MENQNRHYLHDELHILKMIVVTHGGTDPLREISDGHAGAEYIQHYIRVVDEAGAVVLETPGMGQVLRASGSSLSTRGVDVTHRTASGRLILWRTEPLQVMPGREATVQVALDVSNVEAILKVYRQRIALALLIGFLLCLAVSYAIARQGTRPLRRMTEVVRRISASNLEERIPVDGLPRELNMLAGDFNNMLERLGNSFRRLHLSATNLSHKLRTPLTIMRGEAEVALSRDRSVEELQEVIASSLEEVGRLMRLAQSILFLADAEIGKLSVQREQVDCREEADQVVEYYFPFAEEKGIQLSCEGSAAAVADPKLFRKLLGALLSNAVTYNAPGGKVVLKLGQGEDGSAEVSVTDSGCGIAPGEVEKIFDRFYRIYSTRHMDPHGTGLGLPIAKGIMELHSGRITVESVPGEGTTVTAVFPPQSQTIA